MEQRTWWKEAVVYQIYPRSFQDSNGDGIGDLNGIRKRLPYLADLGIDVIWLSPVYQSPNDDNGYDISDYQNIMTEFGSMADFDTMLKEAHKHQLFPDGAMNENALFGDFGPYVNNGPRVHEFLKEMNREVISKFDWLTVGEGAGADTKNAILYTGFDSQELNMVFNFEHVNLGQTVYGKWSDGKVKLVDLKKVFTKWEDGLEGKAWNSLYWDNHDQPRAVSRFGNDSDAFREISAKMLATCLHFMKGTPYIYQGEELGMTNRKCTSFDQFQDIEIKNAYSELVGNGILSHEKMLDFVNSVGRDNARFPMQWDDSDNAGFTTSSPWLEVNENYKRINASLQVEEPNSILNYYKKLIALRHSMDIIVYGVYQLLIPEDDKIFVYTRTLDDRKLLIVCNFTEDNTVFRLDAGFDGTEEVVISNYNDLMVKDHELVLRPYEAKVFKS